MGKLYKMLAFVLLFGSLNKSHAGELQPIELQPIDLDGPYQTSPQKPGEQDRLRKALSKILGSFPTDIVNLIANYFFYKSSEGQTLYQAESMEKVISKFSTNKDSLPMSYLLPAIHADESIILGHELLTSVERTTGLPRTMFILQKWAYQQSPQHEEVRYADGHTVTETTTYPVATFNCYTFGIKMPAKKEWEARERLAKHTAKNKKSRKRKIRSACIVACAA